MIIQKRLIKSFYFFVLLFFAYQAVAQDIDGVPDDLPDLPDDFSLGELLNLDITTATRTTRKFTETPATMRVFTKEDIKRNNWEYLSELLNSVDGFLFVNGSVYTFGQVRGIPDTTGTGNRMICMLDGISINWKLNNGMLDWNLDMAERVEVVVGPASPLYGADAYQGVVNIITEPIESKDKSDVSIKTRDKTDSSNMSVTAGSNETYISNLLIKKSADNFSLMLNLKGKSGDGIKVSGRKAYPEMYFTDNESSYRKPSNAHLNLKYKNLSGYYSFNNLDIGLGTYAVNRGKSPYELYNHNYGLKYSFDITDNIKSILKIYGGNRGFDEKDTYLSVYTFPPEFKMYITQKERFVGVEETLKYINPDFADITVGFQYENQALTDLHRHMNIVSGEYTDTYNVDITAGYLQIEKYITPAFYTIAGLRFDHNSEFDDVFNPRGGIVYSLGEESKLKFMYGEAFRAPKIYELYTTAPAASLIPNPDLDPEKLKTFEIAFNTFLFEKKLWTEGVLYYNEMSDMISSVNIGEGLTQYQNTSDATSKGLNLKLIHKYKFIRTTLGYTYNISEDEDGNDLANTNNHSVAAEIQAEPLNDLFLTLKGFYYDDFYMPESNPYYPKLDGFTRVDLSVLKEGFIFKNFDIGLRVDNIFDEDAGYPGVRGGNIPFSGRLLYTGRAFYAKVTYNF